MSQTTSLRGVIFDLGGVVIDSPLHVIAAYERELGIPDGFINHLVVDTGRDGAWSRMERGEIDMGTFERDFEAECAAGGHTISASTMMSRIAECEPRPAMLRAIGRLRDAGLRVGALTNNWAPDGGVPDEPHEFSDLFHAVIESARVGLRKPDPRIYELACETLELSPREAAFLDDIGRNLKAARALGMLTIKVEDPGRALAELERATGIELG